RVLNIHRCIEGDPFWIDPNISGSVTLMNCVRMLGITCSCVVCVGLAAHRAELKPLEQYGLEPDYQEPQPTDKQREAAVRAMATRTSSVMRSTLSGTLLRVDSGGVTRGRWVYV